MANRTNGPQLEQMLSGLLHFKMNQPVMVTTLALATPLHWSTKSKVGSDRFTAKRIA